MVIGVGVIVSEQVQDAVNAQQLELGFRAAAIRLRLPGGDLGAEHNVAEQAWLGFLLFACRRCARAADVRRRAVPQSATSSTPVPDSFAISMLNWLTLLAAPASPPALAWAPPRARALLTRGERASGFASGVIAFVGVHNVTHKPVPHHIATGEPSEMNVGQAVKYLLDNAQAARLPGWQVHLGDIAGDDHLGSEPEPGQEHLHLLG